MKKLSYLKLFEDFEFLRKEPKYNDLFEEIKKNMISQKKESDKSKSNEEIEKEVEDYLERLYDTLKKHKNTFKSINVIPYKKAKTAEDLEDLIRHAELIERSNKFLSKIPNPLRQNIKQDEDYLNEFIKMLDSFEDYDSYKEFVKKSSAFKKQEPKKFLKQLKSHINLVLGGGKQEILDSIKKEPNAEVFEDGGDYVIGIIFSFEASCKLGGNWCISRESWSDSYWKDYISGSSSHKSTSAPVGLQYFIWDFNHDATDREFLVGVTYYGKDDVAAHFKNDDAVSLSYLTKTEWYDSLLTFNEIPKTKQIKLVVNNPHLEDKLGIISKLSEKEKIEVIDKYPNMLLFINDASGIPEEKIINAIKNSDKLINNSDLVMGMEDDVINDILYHKVEYVKNDDAKKRYEEYLKNNKNIDFIKKLIIKYPHMIKLLGFKLKTKDDYKDVVTGNPYVLVMESKMIEKFTNKELKEMYSKNQKFWDKVLKRKMGILDKNSEEYNILDILLQHISKDENTMEKEDKQHLYYFNAKMEGNKIVFDKLVKAKNNIDVEHTPELVEMKIITYLDSSLKTYAIWVDSDIFKGKDVIDYKDISNDMLEYIKDNKKEMS